MENFEEKFGSLKRTFLGMRAVLGTFGRPVASRSLSRSIPRRRPIRMVIFRQILGQIGKFLTYNVNNFAVLEEPGNDEEALVGGVFDLGSCNMGASHVADIDPEKRAGRKEFGFFELAIDYVADALV